MGSAIAQYWINGPAANGIYNIMAEILLIRLRQTRIPAFHYSIFGANSKT